MGFVTQLGQGLGIMPQTPQNTADFTAAGVQQGQDNRDAANFNTDLNRLNQTGPGGSLTYTTGADGRPVQNYTLSSGQQTLYDNAQNLATGISGLANTSLGQAQNALSQGVTSSLAGSGLQQASGGGAFGGGAAAGHSVAAQAGPAAQTGDAVQATASLASGTNVGPYERAAMGSLADGSYDIQRTFDQSGVRALPGEIDDTSRRRVEEAIMSRINPQYQNDERDLRSRMLNSGIEVGTDAYNREMNNFSQRLNDARMQAVLAGGTEESRQVGLIQGLNAQEYDQALRTGKFGQDADTSMAGNRTQASIANARNSAEISMANARASLEAALANAGTANRVSSQNADALTRVSGQNAGAQNTINSENTAATNQTNLANAGFLQQSALGNANNDTSASIASGNNATQASIANASTALQATALNNNASTQNIANQLAIRDQQMQELAALQGMSQPTGQQFGSYYTGGSAAPTPTLAAAQGASQAWANQNAQADNQGGMFGTLGKIVRSFL